MYSRFDDFRQASSERLCDTLNALAFDGSEASRLVGGLFTRFYAHLRARAGLSLLDAELLLASDRREFEDRLHNRLRGTLDLETTKNLIRLHCGED
jgi:hypothetical protein